MTTRPEITLTHLDEAGGTADDGVPAATPASSQPAASTGADA